MNRNSAMILKTTLIILIFGGIIAISFAVAGKFNLKVDFGTMATRTKDSPFERYASTTNVAPEGGSYMQVKNVIGTVQVKSKSKAPYYNMDISIETTNEALSLRLREDQARVVTIVRNVMAGFSKEDVESEEGREFMRQKIVQELSRVYKTNEIKNVYFEKLLYQTSPN